MIRTIYAVCITKNVLADATKIYTFEEQNFGIATGIFQALCSREDNADVTLNVMHADHSGRGIEMTLICNKEEWQKAQRSMRRPAFMPPDLATKF